MNQLLSLFGKRIKNAARNPSNLRKSPRLTVEHLEQRLVPTLTYNNWPLIQNVQVETVYYGPGWASDANLQQEANGLDQFFGNITNSSYMDMLGEYSAGGYTIGRGQFIGRDTYTGGVPSLVDDATHIQALLNYEIYNGNVPAPTSNPNLVYFVFPPPSVQVTSGGSSSTKDFGGFHNAFVDYAGDQVYYAVIPHPVGNYDYPGLTEFQQLTAVSSHELAEAVTDPIWPNGQVTATGWWNPDKGATGEIGDEAFNTTPDHYCVLNGYVVQKEWSNLANDAVMPAGASAFAGQATNIPMPDNLVSVANAFTHSAESYSNFVTNFYRADLGRSPDAEGLAYWVAQMQNGLTDEQLEAGFIGSAEYIQDHGGTAQGWVQGLYQDVLGRSPDAKGLAYWVGQLGSGASPEAVAYGFAASPEREAQRVTADYQKYLGRSPDADGLTYWVNSFLAGSGNEDLIAGFVGSPEYYQSHGNSNQSWLTSVYQDVLSRAPSQDELDYWLGML
jgi:hypothetical protein